MKSMTKLMVVAMLLVAALVVAPAAAVRDVSSGGTVFIGEKNVNLNGVFDTTVGDSGTLVYYSSVATPDAATIGQTISVSNVTDFELTTSDFGTTGAWYAFNATTAKTEKLTNQSAADGYILVQKPSVKLNVKLAKDGKVTTDSVDGKTVTRNSQIAFELEHNLGISLVGGPFQIDVEVTTPNGGKLNELGKEVLSNGMVTDNAVSLKNLRLTGQKNTTAAISLEGMDAGTYTAIAKWPSKTDIRGSDFYDKGYNSNTVNFEILSKAIAISSSKDSVVRGNNFVVTITGESKADYWVFVKDAAIAGKEYPTMLANQPGVNTSIMKTTAGMIDLEPGYKLPSSLATVDGKNVTNTVAVVGTKADGTRDIEFRTTGDTKDRQFTIRVQEVKDTNKYDDVKVRVEEGDVTITASGTGVYYIGEEITLSGTCTDNKDWVYLFLTGPNLPAAGVNLTKLDKAVSDQKVTFTEEEVDADDTWSYKWNTADLADEAVRTLDAGGYTIYAVSQPKNKDDLSEAKYATAAIQLKTGFLTATSSGAKIAKGDDLKITGTAMGDPDNVFVWIFGKNLQVLGESATVESDGSFEYELKGGDTKDWSAGQYFAVIQHPMMDKKQGIKAGAKDTPKEGWLVGESGSGFMDVKIKALQASDAATALIQALDSPNIDDTYVKLTFDVEEPYIFIDPIGDKAAGSKFTITGTTNAAVGDKLIIDVTSAAFGPSKKTEASGFGASSGNVIVEKGDGANKWSFEVDAADLKPDQYIVKVECIETDTTATANFNLVEAVETTPTTVVTTTAPAGEVTTTAPAGETTTEPTPAPGFGALVALAGLGAVAFLVLRRK
jgi:PGF-CTERM protein